MPDQQQHQTEEKKSDHINVRVVSGDKGEVYFKIRKTTPLKKLMDTYCEKQGISPHSTRFMFEDERLNPMQTAEQAGLENDDLIEAYHEQDPAVWVVALYITSSMHGPLDLKCNVMGNGAVGDDNQTSFKQWLGHTARITLTDGRLFEGQLVAVDSNHTLLMKYCTFHDQGSGDGLSYLFGSINVMCKFICKLEICTE